MNVVYLTTVVGVFVVGAFSMVILPRPTSSDTEKRDLAKYPEFSADSYFNGDYTDDISKWFSDTVPNRDSLMEISAALQEMKGFHQDGVTLIGVGDNTSKPAESSDSQTSDSSSS